MELLVFPAPAIARTSADWWGERNWGQGHVRPIEVEENVGLLAVIGEGMRGTPGLAARIFTAISRKRINTIAIAQGSSELTITIVAHRRGFEQAVQAVHAECRMGDLARQSKQR